MQRDDPDHEPQDDHDLLTHVEASTRLHDEITATEAALETLTASPAAADARTSHQIQATRQRLDLLREAARRNSRSARAEREGAGFLAYHGPGLHRKQDRR